MWRCRAMDCFACARNDGMRTSSRLRGEVKNADTERTHPHVTPTQAAASLWSTLRTKEGGGIRKHRASLMNVVSPQQLKLKIDDASEVSALLLRPSTAHACFVFAHGAGAGMTHDFM